MTYTELVTAVSDYCENTFVTADMNTMIKQAEQRIYNSVQLSNLRKTSTLSLSSGVQYVDAPTDFLSTYSLAIYPSGGGDYIFLLNKDTNFMREAYPNPTTTGTPKHYALFGPSTPVTTLRFSFGPTPDAAYSVDLNYFYYPESIVTATTTWLGTNFDIALFNATMMEAVTYMKGEPDLVALYKDRYESAIFLLKNLGDGKQRMDAYRDGQVRNPVV
jgi:hypothetical protein